MQRRHGGSFPAWFKWQIGRRLGRGYLELGDQRLIEVVHVVEIGAPVVPRPGHLADLDQVIDNLAEIAGALYPPTAEHMTGQQPELIVGEVPQGMAQVLSAD